MCRSHNRSGLTLIELLIATSIMAIMAGVLGALALSVQMHSQHSQGHGEAVQHARVVIDRLQRTMNEATVSPSFPGFFCVPVTYGSYSLPENIVVWRPTGTVADPAGLPRWSEVVVYGPSTSSPGTLLEMTAPTDHSTVPALTDLTSWRAKIAALKTSNTAVRTELTNLVRTANLASSGSTLHPALRFDTLIRPSDQQWTEYKNGSRDWDEIDWVQNIYGTKTGLRQNWCRIEIQLVAGTEIDLDGVSAQKSLTFFGSAAVYQKMYHD